MSTMVVIFKIPSIQLPFVVLLAYSEALAIPWTAVARIDGSGRVMREHEMGEAQQAARVEHGWRRAVVAMGDAVVWPISFYAITVLLERPTASACRSCWWP